MSKSNTPLSYLLHVYAKVLSARHMQHAVLLLL